MRSWLSHHCAPIPCVDHLRNSPQFTAFAAISICGLEIIYGWMHFGNVKWGGVLNLQKDSTHLSDTSAGSHKSRMTNGGSNSEERSTHKHNTKSNGGCDVSWPFQYHCIISDSWCICSLASSGASYSHQQRYIIPSLLSPLLHYSNNNNIHHKFQHVATFAGSDHH